VVVKTAGGSNAAASFHPAVACDLVRTGAERAVRRAAAGDLRLLTIEPPVTIEADYAKGLVADLAASFPGAERMGDRTARFSYPDAESAYRAFLAGNRLAATVD
jgi:D-amino peptidase